MTKIVLALLILLFCLSGLYAQKESELKTNITQNASQNLPVEQIRRIQEDLNTLGYNCGTPDGIIGPKTRKAIMNFQKDYGLVANGELTPETIEKLQALSQKPLYSLEKEEVKKADITQRRYVRKSISYVPFLLQKKKVIIKKENVHCLLDDLRKSVEIERFDYNPLPEKIIERFSSELENRLAVQDSISEEELKDIIKNELVPEIEKVLKINAEMRAKELVTEAERASFIATKAKDLGITARHLETVLNSAYIYIPLLTEYMVIKGKKKFKEQRKIAKDVYKTVEVFKDVLTTRVALKVLWYHICFEDEKVRLEPLATPSPTLLERISTLIKKLTGRPKKEEKGSTYMVIMDKEYKWKGEPVYPEDYAFRKAASSEARKQQLITRKYTEFKLCAPVEEASFSYVKFNLGTKEGLHIDDGYDVIEFIETRKWGLSRRKVGYVKVRKIGDNTRDEAPEFSEAQIITGFGLGKGMSLVEHPLRNIGILPQFTFLPFHIGSGWLRDVYVYESGGMSPGVGVDIQVDMGAIGENPSLSETWLSLSAALAVHEITFRGKEEEIGSLMRFDMGITKKFYFRRLAPFAGIRGGIAFFSVDHPTYEDASFKIRLYEGGILGGLELFILPELSIGGSIGGMLSLPESKWDYKYGKYTYKNISGPKVNVTGFTVSIYTNFTL